jgi:dTDP-4-dehydrorhamnose 3,5-epimerase
LRVVPTELPGVLLVEPHVHHDGRGFFVETYHAVRYREHGIDGPFVQDNHTQSAGGTLRGLHLQLRHQQGKLIRVIEGEVFDVAVDMRRGSPTFGRWVGATLSAGNFRQMYVPPGFAHGFCVVSPVAQLEYKCTDVYDPSSELGVRWNDPDLAITWPITEPRLSERDRHQPAFADVIERLPAWDGTTWAGKAGEAG